MSGVLKIFQTNRDTCCCESCTLKTGTLIIGIISLAGVFGAYNPQGASIGGKYSINQSFSIIILFINVWTIRFEAISIQIEKL